MLRNFGGTAVLACLLLAIASLVPPAREQRGLVGNAYAIETGCSLETLRGGYANSFQFLNANDPSVVPASLGDFTHTPGAGVAQLDFDGRGNYVTKFTVSVGGLILRLEGSGTYTVNSDCTGTRVLNINGGPQGIPFDFVIADNGKEVHELSAQQGDVALGRWKKQ
jgi:hypothetical protein